MAAICGENLFSPWSWNSNLVLLSKLEALLLRVQSNSREGVYPIEPERVILPKAIIITLIVTLLSVEQSLQSGQKKVVVLQLENTPPKKKKGPAGARIGTGLEHGCLYIIELAPDCPTSSSTCKGCGKSNTPRVGLVVMHCLCALRSCTGRTWSADDIVVTASGHLSASICSSIGYHLSKSIR